LLGLKITRPSAVHLKSGVDWPEVAVDKVKMTREKFIISLGRK